MLVFIIIELIDQNNFNRLTRVDKLPRPLLHSITVSTPCLDDIHISGGSRTHGHMIKIWTKIRYTSGVIPDRFHTNLSTNSTQDHIDNPFKSSVL